MPHRQVTFDESFEINTRQKLDVFVTNYFWSDGSPEYSPRPKRLTPRQALREYATYNRPGDTHYTAFEAIDREGRIWDIESLRRAVGEVRFQAELRRKYS